MKIDPRLSKTPANPWSPYIPDAASPWDVRRVVHLHRRAGFAATWDEIRRDLADGPEASVGRVLGGRSRLRGVPSDFDEVADRLADLALAALEAGRLRAWWVYRMLCGPDPLTERLTLMWHNHFATSNLKVDDLAAMRRQNETFRSMARGPFGRLLHAILRDPAMLIWLDAPANAKGHPNENLARELLELFTLGIGPLHGGRRQGGGPRPDRLARGRRRGEARGAPARRRPPNDPRSYRPVRPRRAGPPAARPPGDVVTARLAALPRVHGRERGRSRRPRRARR